jgi:NADPH:quinone reductase-like Zn-dependent oxidoreductase
MKAVVWTAYGPPEVLQIKEVPLPAPADGEVLIRVHATTVPTGDCEMRSLRLAVPLWLLIRAYSGLGKPRRITILGQELAGEVEAAGKDVTLFKTGDRVFAATDLRLRSYAEYICLPQDGVVAARQGISGAASDRGSSQQRLTGRCTP